MPSILLQSLFEISGDRILCHLIMRELYWLPLHYRKNFVHWCMASTMDIGHCPEDMKEMIVSLSTSLGPRCLWSATSLNYEICHTRLIFGKCTFAVSAPKAWNTLPDFLKQTNNIVQFRKDLKTHLFNVAYLHLRTFLCHFRNYVERGLIVIKALMMIRSNSHITLDQN